MCETWMLWAIGLNIVSIAINAWESRQARLLMQQYARDVRNLEALVAQYEGKER